ncbi:Arginase, catabolizes arginine to ornithine and urea [Pichia californica]|uniref:Arginase n=1 Tax=Pichia californica TaxID=460514 RepID=A0A9P7BF96_9ASCO|nr:Arginase, catabolizes arginine to ornithine and urea [[Candida] californica]KAG0688711.1 Arginase, catabolizes arginine to ornithine and urea [[Candida] californica]
MQYNLPAPHYKLYPKKQLTVIKAPFSGGQGKSGVEFGPEKLLEFGLLDDIKSLGWEYTISDPLADLDTVAMKSNSDDTYKNCKRPQMVSECCKRIYNAMEDAYKNESLPITIGGDHSIGMSTISAFINKHPNGGIVWVDAHADINTPSTTESGNLHGCPVAFAMGLDKENWPPHFKWLDSLKNYVKPSQITYIGLRDVDQGEKKILKDLGITAFSMYHVDKFGINEVVRMAMEAVNPTGENPIHLSYDVDGIDPLYVVATGTPVRGGLTLREGLFIVEEIANSGNLASLDIVEVNPLLATKDIHVVDTVNTGLSIARCALGDTIL